PIAEPAIEQPGAGLGRTGRATQALGTTRERRGTVDRTGTRYRAVTKGRPIRAAGDEEDCEASHERTIRAPHGRHNHKFSRVLFGVHGKETCPHHYVDA